jgi:hypothetical protein
VVLGERDELAGDGADLGEVAGEAVLRAAVDGLDRVDDHGAEGLRALVGGAEDLLDALLGHQQEVLVAGGEAGAAGPDLGDRLLAAGVEDDAGAAGEADAGLQQEGRLADAGRAAEQDDAARHEAAAEDAVDLVHAARAARLVVDLGLRVGRGDDAGVPAGRSPGDGAGCSSSTVFHASQVGQRPYHPPVTAPQAWQTQRGATFLGLLMRREGDAAGGSGQPHFPEDEFWKIRGSGK